MAIPYPEEYPQLTFSIDGVSVILTNNEIITYNRNRQTFLEVSRSHNGSIIVAGNNYTPPEEWNLTLSMNDDLFDLLSSIFSISTHKSNTPPRTGFEITIDDICKPMIEYSPSLTQIGDWTETVGGSKKYFAQFKSIFTNFTSVPNGTGYSVELTAIQV